MSDYTVSSGQSSNGLQVFSGDTLLVAQAGASAAI
jgi:hypothetical protein